MSGSWGDDGTIVAYLGLDGGLSAVPAGGGTPVPLVANAGTPVVLPGSSAVLFSSRTTDGSVDIGVLSRRDGRVKTLHAGTSPRFVPTSATDGFLLFLDGTNLLATRFRLDTLEMEGALVAMLDQVAPGPLGVGQFDISYTGRAVFQSGTQNTRNVVIQWLTPTGLSPLLSRPGVYSRLAVSPSGSRIAYQQYSGVSQDVWLYEPSTDTTTRLTFNRGELPRWSPDGRYIAYRNPDGLFRVRADGAGTPSTTLLDSQIDFREFLHGS
jgi:WD40-like Beta Propeller Repeat